MDRTIKVTGKGKLALKPDTIRLRIELIHVHCSIRFRRTDQGWRGTV